MLVKQQHGNSIGIRRYHTQAGPNQCKFSLMLGPNYGVTSPGIGLDFGNEMLSTGQYSDRGFYFSRGEKKYLTSWDEREPWRFITYGKLAINVIRQHFRISESWTVTFHQVGPSTDKHGAYEFPRDVESDSVQPEWENAIYHTVPGSMITYDWGIDRIMAPVLLKKNMSNNSCHLVESTPVVANSPDAGFFLDSPAISFEMQHSAPNFLRTFGWHRKTLVASASTTAAAPQTAVEPNTAATEVKTENSASPPAPVDKLEELKAKEN